MVVGNRQARYQACHEQGWNQHCRATTGFRRQAGATAGMHQRLASCREPTDSSICKRWCAQPCISQGVPEGTDERVHYHSIHVRDHLQPGTDTIKMHYMLHAHQQDARCCQFSSSCGSERPPPPPPRLLLEKVENV